MGEPIETAEMSSAEVASAASVACRAGVVDLQRVRRALRRRSALVRRRILPSLLRRPTLRLLGAPAATTATSLSSTVAATSLASLMVSLRDSSRVRPDLEICKKLFSKMWKNRAYYSSPGLVLLQLSPLFERQLKSLLT